MTHKLKLKKRLTDSEGCCCEIYLYGCSHTTICYILLTIGALAHNSQLGAGLRRELSHCTLLQCTLCPLTFDMGVSDSICLHRDISLKIETLTQIE